MSPLCAATFNSLYLHTAYLLKFIVVCSRGFILTQSDRLLWWQRCFVLFVICFLAAWRGMFFPLHLSLLFVIHFKQAADMLQRYRAMLCTVWIGLCSQVNFVWLITIHHHPGASRQRGRLECLPDLACFEWMSEATAPLYLHTVTYYCPDVSFFILLFLECLLSCLLNTNSYNLEKLINLSCLFRSLFINSLLTQLCLTLPDSMWQIHGDLNRIYQYLIMFWPHYVRASTFHSHCHVTELVSERNLSCLFYFK